MYFDDIFVYSKTKKTHVKHIQYIFQKLQEHSLWIQLKKYSFHKNKMESLRYQIKIQKIKMELTKI